MLRQARNLARPRLEFLKFVLFAFTKFVEARIERGLASATGASTRNFLVKKYPCPVRYAPRKNLVFLIRNPKQYVKIVVFFQFFLPFKAAFLTLMSDKIIITFLQNAHRCHQTTAFFLPIARIHIQMFAPQAFWAMISKTIAFYLRIALFASKILNFSLKMFPV